MAISRDVAPASPYDAAIAAGGSPAGRQVRAGLVALDESRPLALFAWTGLPCIRKVAEEELTCDLFAFLTTEPNR